MRMKKRHYHLRNAEETRSGRQERHPLVLNTSSITDVCEGGVWNELPLCGTAATSVYFSFRSETVTSHDHKKPA